MSPPILRFLTETNWNGRKVALYAMHGGGLGGTLQAVRKLVEARGGLVVSVADFRDLRRGNSESTRQRAATWAREAVEHAEKM